MKLNIGGSKGYDTFIRQACNWTIIDVRKQADVVCDISQEKLPFEDNSIKAIYTSHTLEHIYPHRLPFVISEFYRVLKPSCRVRIVVPNIDKAIKAYMRKKFSFLKDKRNPSKPDYLPNLPICHLMSWFFTYRTDTSTEDIGMGHVMVFNFQLLRYFLEKAGFRDIIKSSFNSGDKIFHLCDFERYKNCSLYVEACK